MARNYYAEIDTILRSYEEHKPYHEKTLEWTTDRIWWCWKWRKITKDQMNALAARANKLFEGAII